MTADHSRVEAGPHPHKNHPPHLGELLLAEEDVLQLDGWRVELGPASYGVENGLRLLRDLLEHKVLMLPLGRRYGVVRDLLWLFLQRPSFAVPVGNSGCRDLGHFPVV